MEGDLFNQKTLIEIVLIFSFLQEITTLFSFKKEVILIFFNALLI